MCEVSIIVPLYNGGKTIEHCLKSLTTQELKEIEIIVVDDGSKDDGPEIVHHFMQTDHRIRFIRQENQGAGTARNNGIRMAGGKYIGFVDCDDFVDSAMFRVLYQALESKGVPVAICQEKNVYFDNGKIQIISETKYPVTQETVYSADTVLEWLLNYRYMSLNSMCYKLVSRSVFTEKKIWMPQDHRHAEDLVTSIGILANVDAVVIVPNSYYFYVHDRGSHSYAYSVKFANDVYLDWHEACDYIRMGKKKCDLSNFSLGMYFSSFRQLLWAEEKNMDQVRELEKKWKEVRKKERWKPELIKSRIPLVHAVKVCVAYWGLCKPMMRMIKMFSWIPFIKYMA